MTKINKRTQLAMKELEKLIYERKKIHSKEMKKIQDELIIARETFKKILKILQKQQKINIIPDIHDTRFFYICAKKEKIGVIYEK